VTQVARNTEGPLAEEFFRVLQEIQLGRSRAEALEQMAQRVDVEELNSFVSAVVQADSLGIPIAQVLRVQAREMRIKRSQRAEEAAQKVPVKILFPLIFCILPSLFVIVVGPAAVTIVHAFF
jgi:tight adherence protein C